ARSGAWGASPTCAAPAASTPSSIPSTPGRADGPAPGAAQRIRSGGRVREALKKLRGESLVYGVGQAGGRAVQLLLVPVLTRLLQPGAFGAAALGVSSSRTAWSFLRVR